jgi:hypothetical protein
VPAVAERQIQKLNQRDPDAAPIVETELFDIQTGERIPKGWKRRPPREKGYPNFTIPAPESIALGLRPELSVARPGRYIVPSREFETTATVEQLRKEGVLAVAA